MASYPVYTVAQMSATTGRPVSKYGAFGDEAIRQATFLFKMLSGLSEFPDNADDAQLAKYGILYMADHLCLMQPHAELLASPKTSETIGSYSYSKSASIQMLSRIKAGDDSGVYWFDLALSMLGISDTRSAASSGLHFFENDYYTYTDENGRTDVLGPADFYLGGISPFGEPKNLNQFGW